MWPQNSLVRNTLVFIIQSNRNSNLNKGTLNHLSTQEHHVYNTNASINMGLHQICQVWYEKWHPLYDQ